MSLTLISSRRVPLLLSLTLLVFYVDSGSCFQGKFGKPTGGRPRPLCIFKWDECLADLRTSAECEQDIYIKYKCRKPDDPYLIDNPPSSKRDENGQSIEVLPLPPKHKPSYSQYDPQPVAPYRGTPSATSYRDAPAATSYRDAPAATSYRDAPAATSYRDAPAATSYQDAPAATSYRDAPAATSYRDAASATSYHDTPAASPYDSQAAAPYNDLPVSGPYSDSSAAGTYGESPAATSDADSPAGAAPYSDTPAETSYRDTPTAPRYRDPPPTYEESDMGYAPYSSGSSSRLTQGEPGKGPYEKEDVKEVNVDDIRVKEKKVHQKEQIFIKEDIISIEEDGTPVGYNPPGHVNQTTPAPILNSPNVTETTTVVVNTTAPADTVVVKNATKDSHVQRSLGGSGKAGGADPKVVTVAPTLFKSNGEDPGKAAGVLKNGFYQGGGAVIDAGNRLTKVVPI